MYVHDPKANANAAVDVGRLRPRVRQHGLAWDIAGFCAEPSTNSNGVGSPDEPEAVR